MTTLPGSTCILCSLAVLTPALDTLAQEFNPQTRVALVDGRWHINGEVTYPGAPAEGLLMNVGLGNGRLHDPVAAASDFLLIHLLNDLNQYVPFEFNGAADNPVVYGKLQQLTSPASGF